MHSDAVPQRVKRVFKLKSERSLKKLWCVSFALQNSEDEKGKSLLVSSQKEDWGGGVNPTFLKPNELHTYLPSHFLNHPYPIILIPLFTKVME